MIAVVPAFRKQGIGEKLLEHSLKKFKKWEAHSVWGLVQSSNKTAQEFYKKRGFKIKSRPLQVIQKNLEYKNIKKKPAVITFK